MTDKIYKVKDFIDGKIKLEERMNMLWCDKCGKIMVFDNLTRALKHGVIHYRNCCYVEDLPEVSHEVKP